MHARHGLHSASTLVDLAVVRASPRVRRVAIGLALSLAFAGLTAVGAAVVIPIEPVPVTLQTLFVLLAGASLGRGWGPLSQAFYVGLGAAGLPMFAGGASGASLLAGPTGGYLVGFVVAPYVVGAMLRRTSRLSAEIAAFSAGKLLILTLGVAHLTLFHTHDLGRALMVGFVPFIPGGFFKIAAAVSIHHSSRSLVHHYRGRK